MRDSSYQPETVGVHAGREDLRELGLHALPIDLSSTNPLSDIESGGDSYESITRGGLPVDGGGSVYQRLWNPTVARFERGFAVLEGAEATVALSSGMAAITACLLALTHNAGKKHVVAVRPIYGGTDHLLTAGTLGIDVSFCGPDEIGQNLRPDTGAVIIETPANPTLELVDIELAVAAAGEVPVLVDNTFATPILQNPLKHGAAISLHSATKFIGGHGDVLAGVVACSEDMAKKIRDVRVTTGSVLHPLAAYLLHRGLQTLKLRVEAQQANALAVANWLESRDEISEAFYPDRVADPTGIFGRQLRGGGSIVSVRLAGGFDAASRLTERVQLFTHAVSLGGVDSLVQHPAALSHRHVPENERPAGDILRFSIGLEHPDDLITDLSRAICSIR